MGKAVEELLQQAYQKGVKEGYEQGEDEGAITVLKAVLQNLNWSPEQGSICSILRQRSGKRMPRFLKRNCR